ncbi:MAG TPA: hypothetical protein DDW52_24915 [Planctomycetaceae bacterium]|nr:hypothetical protein [Planctomycetaceae bacterium]
MARYDDLNTTAIGYATYISTVLFLIIVLLLRALTYYWLETESQSNMAEARYVSSDEEIARQQAEFADFGTAMVTVTEGEGADAVTKEVERQRIPLDKAKDLLLKELAKEPSAEEDA